MAFGRAVVVDHPGPDASGLDRPEASKLLADRGWGKAPTYVAIEEDDPLALASLEQAAEGFRPASFG